MKPPLAALALLCVAAVGAGHETWLLPAAFDGPPGKPVRLELTSGTAFPTPGNAIKPDRVAEARVRDGGEARPVKDVAAGPKALRLGITPAGGGVLHAWVRLKPRRIELDEEQVAEYLTEIDASAEVRAAWNKAARPRQWREAYSKTATTFVRSGPGAGWAKPIGAGLEVVPGADPTGLEAGDSLPVRVFLGGKPVDGFALGCVREGGKPGPFRRTGADGGVTVPFPDAGRHLLYGTHLRRSAAADTDWDSDFTTLTLEVRKK